jgi:hypothetical protein
MFEFRRDPSVGVEDGLEDVDEAELRVRTRLIRARNGISAKVMWKIGVAVFLEEDDSEKLLMAERGVDRSASAWQTGAV